MRVRAGPQAGDEHADAQRDVKVLGDGKGAVVERCDYDDYGRLDRRGRAGLLDSLMNEGCWWFRMSRLGRELGSRGDAADVLAALRTLSPDHP